MRRLRRASRNRALHPGLEAMESRELLSGVHTLQAPTPVDLGLSTAASPTTVNINSPVTYALTLTSAASGGNASNVYVTDTLPAGVTFVPGSSTPGLIQNGGTVIDPVGNVASGASQTITVVVMPNVGAQGTTLTNTAVVTSLEPDSDLDNNTTTDSTVAVNATVDVSITKIVTTAVPGVIAANQGMTYTLTVTNTGPSDASNVVVTDTLPAGVTTAANVVNAPGGTVVVNGNIVTVTYATLAAPASEGGPNSDTITITALTSGPFTQNTTLVNTATVQPNEFNLSTQTTATVSTLLDTTSPTVVGASRYGYHTFPTVFVLQFSKALDPATATNLANYTLTGYPNAHLPNWWLHGSPLTISNAVYDPTTFRVYLYPTQLLPLNFTYGVVVSGVTDLVGHPLPEVSTSLFTRASVKGLIPPAINPTPTPVVGTKVVAHTKAKH